MDRVVMFAAWALWALYSWDCSCAVSQGHLPGADAVRKSRRSADPLCGHAALPMLAQRACRPCRAGLRCACCSGSIKRRDTPWLGFAARAPNLTTSRILCSCW